MKKKRVNNDIKLGNFVLILALFLFLILLIRTAYLALSKEVDGIDLKTFAANRTTRRDIITAKRGTIYDLNGEALAQNVFSYTLIAYLSPNRGEGHYVKDKENTAVELSNVINMEKDEILRLLNKDLYQTEFGKAGKGLTEIEKEKIEALRLPGVSFIESQKRYYPKGDFLSYTLGYAKQDNEGNIKGELGLEMLYNTELTGTDGSRLYQKDLKGYKIAGTPEVVVDSKNGNDIYLTIDSSIQFILEQAIDNIAEKYRFEQVNVVVAEAKTGKILALSTYPSFDPNERNLTQYMDPNVSIAFEPGSTMKIFSYMAVMEKGKYNGSETFKSGIFKTSDGTEIGDWNRNGWGEITYDKGFAMSSNVAVVNLLNKYLTKEELLEYYQKLGFGSKTGIELANETSGKLDFKYETEYYNAGFGQRVMTTSIQYVKALTSIANDGVILKPYLVEKIVDSDGNVVMQNKREEVTRVASTATIEKMKDLMESVVQSGTGSGYKMDGYDIIAKTGTAQIASENGKGYLRGDNDVIRGFAGLYPKDDPDIIIYANMKRPNPNSATPLNKLVKEVVTNITKIRNNTNVLKENKKVKIESYLNKNLNDVKLSLETKGIDLVIIGDGDKITGQYPKSCVELVQHDKVFLLTNSKNINLPNMNGWSRKEVSTYLDLVNIKSSISGNGYLVSQNYNEGTPISEIDNLELIFEEKF